MFSLSSSNQFKEQGLLWTIVRPPMWGRTTGSILTAPKLLAIALFLLVAGCGGREDDPSHSEQEVPFTTLDGTSNRVFPVGTYIVRSQDSWVSAWTSGYYWFPPDSPTPTLDFGRVVLVGVSVGLGPGCDGRFAAIDRVLETFTAIQVEYRLQDVPVAPAPGISCHGTLNFPLNQFVTFPFTTKPVTFIRKSA